MKERRSVVEHPFGTIKFWNHQYAFLTRGFDGVRTELVFSVLAYNLKRLARLVPMRELLGKLAVRRRSRLGQAARTRPLCRIGRLKLATMRRRRREMPFAEF
jgi:hypothetical protein